MPRILIEIDGLDPATNTRVTVRAASADDKAITNLNGQRWVPAITRLPSLSWDGFDGDFTGEIAVGAASFELNLTAIKRFFANSPRYRWSAAPVRIYVGETGAAWASWSNVFDGIVSGAEVQGATLKLDAEVDTEPFNANVLTALYAGSGGAEGGTDIKSKPKPAAFGRCKNVEPVLIDAVNNVYQVHGYGAVSSISAVYERAADFGASFGNFATYAALVAAVIPPGRWATCHAAGMFRLGAPAAGVITADVDGDAVSGFVRTTAAIITRILDIASVPAGNRDTTSLTAFGVAVPATINIYVTEQTTVLDLVQRLVRPCNAAAGISWTGKLFVTRFAAIPASPATTLDYKGRSKPVVLSIDEQRVSAPYFNIEMQADRSWRVHTLEEVAFTAELIDRGDYNSLTTYREGNIVRQPADGKRYLYINPTASSGNAPPNAVYWALLEANTVTLFRSTTQPVIGYEGLGWINDSTGQAYAHGGFGLTYGGTAATYGGQQPDIPWYVIRDAAAANFNRRNDQLATTPVAPHVPPGGAAIDHVQNDDGSVDLSFEWNWHGVEDEIDGFEVIVYSSTSATPYTIGTAPALELVIQMPANRRALFLAGVPSNRYYTFGVRAYRVVDFNVSAAGFIRSAVAQPTESGENPYLPTANVAFAGNITGTVGGRAASTIAATIGADGSIATGKVIASSLAADTLTKVVSAVGTNVTSNDAGVELLRVQSVPVKPSQGGFVHLILTCTVILSTTVANTSSILYARLQRSPAGANTWTELDSWKMSQMVAPTYIDDGLGAFVDGLAWRGSAATQFADVPPSDGSYDYRWLVSKTPDGTGSTSANVVAGQVERGRGLAISVRVAA